MNDNIPYNDDYKKLKKFRSICFWELVIISILSVGLPIIKEYCYWLYKNFDFINICLIITYYILVTLTEVFIYPKTAKERRKGLIDNSLGTKLLDKPLEGYFSNDSISCGFYKLAVNCYENCFFSYKIAESMTLTIVIKNSFFLFLFLMSAYFGFKESIVATPIIQIFTSSLFLGELIHHLNFCSKLKNRLDEFKLLFYKGLKKDDIGIPIFYMLDYETILAFNKSTLSDKEYKKMNEKLSREWEELKKRYDIK